MDSQTLIDSIVSCKPVSVVEMADVGRLVWRPVICGVYLIECTASGGVYVGSSVDIVRRWRAHLSYLRKGNHHSARVQRTWNKYGPESFTFRVFMVTTEEDRIYAEDRALQDHRGVALNTGLVAASAARGRMVSDATRAKMSRGLRGLKRSPETRARMSAAKKGIPRRRGWKHSPESRAKMSASQVGRPSKLKGSTRPARDRTAISLGIKSSAERSNRVWPSDADHGMARAVEVDGVKYDTVDLAATGLNVMVGTVIARIRRGMGRYLDDPSSKQTKPWGLEDKRGKNHKNARAVYVGELYFECCKDAAVYYGIHPSSFAEWIQNGKARYADGLPPMKIGPKPARVVKNPGPAVVAEHWRNRMVEIDGIIHPSLNGAAIAHGVSRNTIGNWISSGRAIYAEPPQT